MRFPKFLGDSSGSTTVSAFDVDSAGNIIIGGNSYSSLVSSSGNAYAALFPSN